MIGTKSLCLPARNCVALDNCLQNLGLAQAPIAMDYFGAVNYFCASELASVSLAQVLLRALHLHVRRGNIKNAA